MQSGVCITGMCLCEYLHGVLHFSFPPVLLKTTHARLDSDHIMLQTLLSTGATLGGSWGRAECPPMHQPTPTPLQGRILLLQQLPGVWGAGVEAAQDKSQRRYVSGFVNRNLCSKTCRNFPIRSNFPFIAPTKWGTEP